MNMLKMLKTIMLIVYPILFLIIAIGTFIVSEGNILQYILPIIIIFLGIIGTIQLPDYIHYKGVDCKCKICLKKVE